MRLCVHVCLFVCGCVCVCMCVRAHACVCSREEWGGIDNDAWVDRVSDQFLRRHPLAMSRVLLLPPDLSSHDRLEREGQRERGRGRERKVGCMCVSRSVRERGAERERGR